MPTLLELVKARFSVTREELKEALGHLDQDSVSWAPAAGMRTVGGQLIEIAGTELQTVTMLKGGPWVPDDQVRALIGDFTDLKTLLTFLDSVRNDTLAYLDSLGEEELAAEIEFGGWQLGLSSVPRAEVFRSIAQHEAYHTGQLYSYLWAKGDNPYKW